MSGEQWTPGFGQKYQEEPVFYKSPTIKEFSKNRKRERTDMPNAAMTRTDKKYYTDEELASIWAKPVENFEVTPEEAKILKENPDKLPLLLHRVDEAPCQAHLYNIELDRCFDEGVGSTNATMLQRAACNEHLLKFTLCVGKHHAWYKARIQALEKILEDAE